MERARPHVAVAGALALGYEGLPADFAERRTAELEALAGRLSEAVGAPCSLAGVVADVAAARALGRRLATERPAALVVVAPIAARADVQWALAQPVDAPVLAWDATLRPGPATLLGFTPVPDGWRLVSWQGELTADALDGLGVPHGFFRGRPGGHDGWAALVEAGVPHHAALAAGHVGPGCRLLAARTGLEHVAIDG